MDQAFAKLGSGESGNGHMDTSLVSQTDSFHGRMTEILNIGNKKET